jgi:hypothetical protein
VKNRVYSVQCSITAVYPSVAGDKSAGRRRPASYRIAATRLQLPDIYPLDLGKAGATAQASNRPHGVQENG